MCKSWGSRDDGPWWSPLVPVVNSHPKSFPVRSYFSFIMKAKEILWMQVGEILKSLTRHDPAPKFNWWILKGGTLMCFTGSFPCPSLSQDMGGSPNCCSESGMSLVMSSVWRSYSEPAAADVWTPSIWLVFVESFLMNLIILIGVCWFF